ncbi:FAD/NAD(P)-binding domain-containing protein [Schizophyllum commune H4-8]|uniref:FAD/NAD(P)-binding domain-containing protein n=1 Tax=Schizophyllum commune (strain H4-8 / FGSC 9210) TaxID=578458 RepID=UPI002160A12D|nr:FAD/NAD(P)-binding domain-containing protein [Schizophyllum commune H4-8]KAI5885322.1 FAD/NAD(P)-binding domain-containing protein [Schizophyllum commune H4-8]
MTTDAPRKINIAVIGGGIGGLATVLAIQHFCDMSQLEVTIYESASQINQIGAGINLWAKVCEMLSGLGLKEDIDALLRANENYAWTIRKSDQAQGVPMCEVQLKDSERLLLLHRAVVQDILLRHISPAVKICLSHRLESYTYTEDAALRNQLNFKDGQVARCDLLIAADGVHSTVRRQFLPALAKKLGRPELLESVDPLFSGSKAYRNLVPTEKLAAEWPGHPALTKPRSYCGKNKHMITYPVSGGRVVNVVPFHTDPSKVDTPFLGSQIGQGTAEEVLKIYEGWEPEVQAVIKCMENPSHWAILTLKPFDTWADDGVFLLGDAAHAMNPHIGTGACEAIEVYDCRNESFLLLTCCPPQDGHVLARILARAQKKGPLEMLSNETMALLYNRLRPPKANFVSARARLQGLFYEFNEEGANLSLVEKDSPMYTAPDRLGKVAAGIRDGYYWPYTHSLVRQAEETVALALSTA